MSDTEAAKIAASLTEAQRRWLPEFDAEPKCWFPPAMARVTRKRMIALGLLEESAVRERGFPFQMIGYRLTPLGLAVRAYLTGASDNA